jgi:hypothetical protein
MVFSFGRRGSKRRVFTLIVMAFLFWYLYFDGVDIRDKRSIDINLRIASLSNTEGDVNGGKGWREEEYDSLNSNSMGENLSYSISSCKVHESAEQYKNVNSSFEITLVTSWFPLGSASKHAHNQYMSWMTTFLSATTSPIVVFTTEEGKLDVESCRGNLPIHYIIYDDIWNFPWLQRGGIIESYTSRQYELDEDKFHTPSLYAVWNAKSAMVMDVINLNPFCSEYFFWVDIGSFRMNKYTRWPDVTRVKAVFDDRPCRLLFSMAGSLRPKANMSMPFRGLIFTGTSFGGKVPAWRWWFQEYTSLHDKWLSDGHFVGNDQMNLNVAVQRNIRRVMMLDTRDLPDACGFFTWTPYYYYQRWFAIGPERKIAEPVDYPCPDRKVIIAEQKNDVHDWPEKGCKVEPWDSRSDVQGVPKHAFFE